MFSGRNTDGTGRGNQGYNNPNDPGYNQGQSDSGQGPHSSSLLNKLDPRVDSKTGLPKDRDNSDGGAFGTDNRDSGYRNTTDYDRSGNNPSRDSGYNTQHTGISPSSHGSGNTGPHNSNLANKFDPRVDSDNSRGNYGNNTGTYGGNTGGHTGTHGSNTTSGPHSSNLANKADPRVDSDRDGSRTAGGNTGTYGSNTGNYGSNTGNYGSNTTSGPHNSNLANKADPRVDSDRDGSRTTGGNTGNTGTYGSNTGNYGSNTGNTGSYNDNNTTAGPHKSNILNKLDPRVDSDRDGSRTAGGDNTNTGSGLGGNQSRTMGQEITSHGHAQGLPESALDGRHAKHTAGIGNATASATVSGGAVPEGSANAAGPVAADAETTAAPAGTGRHHGGGQGHGPGHTLGGGNNTRNY